MKMTKLLLPVIAIVISIVAIIISSITLSSKDDSKILDAYQIGLGDFSMMKSQKCILMKVMTQIAEQNFSIMTFLKRYNLY